MLLTRPQGKHQTLLSRSGNRAMHRCVAAIGGVLL
jgi:hypothetical protein